MELTSEQKERYNRQVILDGIGEEGQIRLLQSRVLVVGAGGLGSPILMYLAAAGVGTIGVMDDDTVSLSNLQRQVLYDESQVGQSKATCAMRRIKAMNSDITVNAYPTRLTKENAEDFISQYDIVVDGCDNFATRYVISDVCQLLGKPYVYGAIHGYEGQVAVLCKKDSKGLATTFRTLFPEEDTPPSGKEVIGVTPAIVGSVEASQVLQLICKYGEPFINRLWTIDLRTMQTFCINTLWD